MDDFWRQVNRLNPFSAPDFLEGLEAAELEQALGNWHLIAIKALHGSIVINQIAFLGLFIAAMKYMGAEAVTLYTLTQQMSWLEWGGVAIALYIVLLFNKYLAQYFTRFVVMVAGFTISLQPDQIVRNYVYSGATKLYMFALMALVLILHFTLWLGGARGLMEFLMPRFSVWFSGPIFMAMVLAYVLASVVFPATRMRIQDHQEIFELLVANDITKGLRLLDKMRRDAVRIAAPTLGAQLAIDVRQRGPEALSDWVFVPEKDWQRLAAVMKVPLASFQGAKQVRTHTVDGKLKAAVTDQSGQVTIHDEHSLGQRK